jgi:beta-glucosidase
MVLLRNEHGLLPLDPASLRRLAVIGRLAAVKNLGDGGSSNVHPPHVVTPLDGLRAALPNATIVHDDGGNAAAVATDVDAAIVVVGYTHHDEGEFIDPNGMAHLFHLFPPMTDPDTAPRLQAAMKRAASGFGMSPGGDRRRLELSVADEALVRAVAAANPRTVVAVMSGSAVVMEQWRTRVPAIVQLWYPGMEGGHALADVLFGKVSPSGRLPFAVPRDPAQLPHFDRNARSITYDLWHGYRKLDRDGAVPAFPFGFGLTYTAFSHRSIAVERDAVGAEDTITVTVEVENTGARDGEEVVQLYAEPIGSAIERAPRELRAFARIAVPSGQTRAAQIALPVRSLAYFDESRDDFSVEPIAYDLVAGRHERDDGPRARIRVRG